MWSAWPRKPRHTWPKIKPSAKRLNQETSSTAWSTTLRKCCASKATKSPAPIALAWRTHWRTLKLRFSQTTRHRWTRHVTVLRRFPTLWLNKCTRQPNRKAEVRAPAPEPRRAVAARPNLVTVWSMPSTLMLKIVKPAEFRSPGQPGRLNDPYFHFQHVFKSFGEQKVLEGVTFRVFRGETVCVLGRR